MSQATHLELFVPRLTDDDAGDDGGETATAHEHRPDVREVV